MQDSNKARRAAITTSTVARLVFGAALSIGLGWLAAGPLEFRGGMLLAPIALFGLGGFIIGFMSECVFRTDTSYLVGFIAGGLFALACVCGIGVIMER
jgi:hypothetical protein